MVRMSLSIYMKGDYEVWPEVVSVLSGICLFIAVLCVPISLVIIKSEIQERKAFVITISNARLDELSDLERATITKDIAKWNQWLAKEQFFKKNIWF